MEKKRRLVISAFLLLEAGLYLAFMGMDLFAGSSNTTVLKYSGILLCLLFSALCAHGGGDRMVPYAQLFTALADYFLLVIDREYLAGIFFFSIAQILYLIRLDRMGGRIWLPVRIVSALLAVLLLFWAGLYSPLNLAAVLYFSLLLVNMVLSWTIPSGTGRMFALGLSLFVLCDLCVGLFQLSVGVPVRLRQFSGIGMWLFYLPSQVLISLSCLNAARPKTK